MTPAEGTTPDANHTTDNESRILPHSTPNDPEAARDRLDSPLSIKRKADDSSGLTTLFPKKRFIGDSAEGHLAYATVEQFLSISPEASIQKVLRRLPVESHSEEDDGRHEDRNDKVDELLKQRVQMRGPDGIVEQTGVSVNSLQRRKRQLEETGELYTNAELDAEIDEMLMQKCKTTGPGGIMEMLDVSDNRIRHRKEALEKAGQLSKVTQRHDQIDNLIKAKVKIEGPGGIADQLGVGTTQVRHRKAALKKAGAL